MTFVIRQHVATEGLEESIEGDFGLPVELTTPDGIEIKTNEKGKILKGQVLYDSDGIDPEEGDMIVISEIRITLRITALSRVPEAGENWQIKFPLNPAFPDVLTQQVLNSDKAPEVGQSIGFITLFPQEAEQS